MIDCTTDSAQRTIRNDAMRDAAAPTLGIPQQG